jgi:hypothetical protein
MGMLAWKKGKNLQEVTRLAKDSKVFRMWRTQPGY